MNQEAVVELHPEELQLSADEDDSDGGHGDHDKGLKIRRTVTQVRSRRCARPHPCICCSHSNSHFELLVIIFFPFFFFSVRSSQVMAKKMDRRTKKTRQRRP